MVSSFAGTHIAAWPIFDQKENYLMIAMSVVLIDEPNHSPHQCGSHICQIDDCARARPSKSVYISSVYYEQL